ncbi:MAG: hypothetical protein ACRDIV_14600 [Ktedonobacteraceae bacterium]
MRLAEAMIQNGSAQIGGRFKQAPNYHVPFDVYVKYIVAKEVFNPNEQSFPTGGYVAPGKYKVILVPDPRVPGGGGPMGCSSDLTKCERYVQAQLIDYDPDGWQPSSGKIIDLHVRTDADWVE